MPHSITIEDVTRPSPIFRGIRQRFMVEPLAVTTENLEGIGIPAWSDVHAHVRALQATASNVPMLVEYADLEVEVVKPADTQILGYLSHPQELPFDIVLGIHALFLHGVRSLLVDYKGFNIAYVGGHTFHSHLNAKGYIAGVDVNPHNRIPKWRVGTRFFYPSPAN